MTAAEALEKAGLKPLSTSSRGGVHEQFLCRTRLQLLLVADGKQVARVADLIHAMDKLGKIPASPDGVAGARKAAFKWVAWTRPDHGHAEEGAIFSRRSEAHSARPESMRAPISARARRWQAWASLRDNVLVQINSGDRIRWCCSMPRRAIPGALDTAVHEVCT